MPEIIPCMPALAAENTHTDASFNKAERLCKKNEIEDLFRHGKIFRTDTFKIYYRFGKQTNNNHPSKILISVPKKQQPLAVNRNKIKRLIRESWRRNKTGLYRQLIDNKLNLQVAIICFSIRIPDYKEIESKIILTLQQLTHQQATSKIDKL